MAIKLDKIHPIKIRQNIEPDEDLGRSLVALRYDKFLPVIEGMIKEARRQSEGDMRRGRTKLANSLLNLSRSLENSKNDLENIVKICKVYIEEEKKLEQE